jgi:hypothetical protein
MPEDTYAIQFHECSGHACVDMQGKLNAQKIRNTFAVIAMNKTWVDEVAR